jgi:GNAT superfamily N-acetyltransferase
VSAAAGIDIRRATADDAPFIAQVRIDGWRTTYRGLVPDAYLDAMEVEPSTAMWARVLEAGSDIASVFVATRGGEVIGFSAGNALKEPRYGADSELTAVYLRREFQRAGIGQRLVGAVVDAERARGATGMIAWTIAGNKGARRFYESLGGDLVVEQPFQWDGMDLVEAGYVWLDLAALSAACAMPRAPTSTLQ